MSQLPYINETDWDHLVEFLASYGMEVWDFNNRQLAREWKRMCIARDSGAFVPKGGHQVEIMFDEFGGEL